MSTKERSKTFHNPTHITFFSTINTEESLIRPLNILDSTPNKIKPFISYREEKILKNDQNYLEVSIVMDEITFIIEVSQELENSPKVDSFLQNYDIYFSKYMRAFEENFLINKNCIIKKENDILKNINFFEFYDRGYFTSKYLQRFKKFEEINQVEVAPKYQAENAKCNDQNCFFQMKLFKNKM